MINSWKIRHFYFSFYVYQGRFYNADLVLCTNITMVITSWGKCGEGKSALWRSFVCS